MARDLINLPKDEASIKPPDDGALELPGCWTWRCWEVVPARPPEGMHVPPPPQPGPSCLVHGAAAELCPSYKLVMGSAVLS